MTCSCTDTIAKTYTITNNGSSGPNLAYRIMDADNQATDCEQSLTVSIARRDTTDCARLTFTFDAASEPLGPPNPMKQQGIAPCEVAHGQSGYTHTYNGKFQFPPVPGEYRYDWKMGDGSPNCTITIVIQRK